MAKREKRKEFMVEDAKIIYRNFTGRTGPYNATGQREFSVIIPPESIDGLSAEGWNVKIKEPQEEGDEPFAFITVKVGFKYPPRVTMMTSRARTPLTEETISILDSADILSVDVICQGSEWDVNGKTGLSAYLKTLFVTIQEDYLEKKYAINEVEEG